MGSSKKGSSGGQVDVKSFPFQLYLGQPASPSLKIFLLRKKGKYAGIRKRTMPNSMSQNASVNKVFEIVETEYLSYYLYVYISYV